MSTADFDRFNFDNLPEVDLGIADDVSTATRVPRFDGDVSALPDQACWVFQNLLTRRYLSKADDTTLWAWLVEYRSILESRLCELDLRLRIDDALEVAFSEPATIDSPSPYGRKVLRREPLGTYASIVALHLARIARTSHDEHVLIGRGDIHDLFGSVRHKVDRDEAMLSKRINEAINKLINTEILLRSRTDEDSFTISPVILAIMTGQRVDELTQEFEQLRNANPPEERFGGGNASDGEENENAGEQRDINDGVGDIDEEEVDDDEEC
ncbi:MAG: DUF4194 domain-containing protein [Actinomycetia bacterium]|nr:DUF4194 domain-containing protein [Actinomycetes bacterium]